MSTARGSSAWTRSRRLRRVLWVGVAVVAVIAAVVLVLRHQLIFAGLTLSVSALVLAGITRSTPPAPQ